MLGQHTCNPQKPAVCEWFLVRSSTTWGCTFWFDPYSRCHTLSGPSIYTVLCVFHHPGWTIHVYSLVCVFHNPGVFILRHPSYLGLPHVHVHQHLASWFELVVGATAMDLLKPGQRIKACVEADVPFLQKTLGSWLASRASKDLWELIEDLSIFSNSS